VTRDDKSLVIAVLGLGEAGSVIARDLTVAGAPVRGYDPAVTAAGPVLDTASEAEAAREAQLVLSVNSAEAAVEAFKAGLPGLLAGGRPRPDVLWADLNTASPGTKRQLAALAADAGVPFADVAMMAPVPGRGLRVPMLASGTGAARYAALLRPLGAGIEVLDGPAGLAASKKLLRSVFYKGMAASIVEALDAARAAGDEPWLREHIAAELAAAATATLDRITDGTRRHAVRRAAEMAAAADMLTELGVPPLMAEASRALHERLAAAGGLRQRWLTPAVAYAASGLRQRRERLGQRLQRVGLGVERQVHDDEVDARVAVGGRRRDRGLQATVRVDAHVDRTSDLVHVPPDGGAVPGQHLLQLEPVLRSLRDGVPLLGEARHGAQRALLSAAADGDRRVRPLHRLRLAPRVGEPNVSSGERGGGLAQQADDGLDALVEPVEPLA